MPYAGETYTAVLTLDQHDNTTAVTVTTTDPTGATSAPQNATTADNGATWTTQVPVTAGLWLLTWTVTGLGAGVHYQQVAVAPKPGYVDPAAFTYATSGDYATYTQLPPPLDCDRKLVRASEIVDSLITTAVYETDATDKPVKPELVTALRNATCEIVKWWVEIGDESGASSLYQSVSIGGVSLSRVRTGQGRGKSTVEAPRMPEQAIVILRNAGLLDATPWVWS